MPEPTEKSMTLDTMRKAVKSIPLPCGEYRPAKIFIRNCPEPISLEPGQVPTLVVFPDPEENVVKITTKASFDDNSPKKQVSYTIKLEDIAAIAVWHS